MHWAFLCMYLCARRNNFSKRKLIRLNEPKIKNVSNEMRIKVIELEKQLLANSYSCEYIHIEKKLCETLRIGSKKIQFRAKKNEELIYTCNEKKLIYFLKLTPTPFNLFLILTVDRHKSKKFMKFIEKCIEIHYKSNLLLLLYDSYTNYMR